MSILKHKQIMMNIIVHEHQVSNGLLVRYYDDDRYSDLMFNTTIVLQDIRYTIATVEVEVIVVQYQKKKYDLGEVVCSELMSLMYST